MKPYIYTDPDGDTIRIEDGAITATATADQQSVFVALPDVADDAIELARQILKGAGVPARIVTD